MSKPLGVAQRVMIMATSEGVRRAATIRVMLAVAAAGQIAFASVRDGGWEILLTNADGSSPAWRPR